MSDSRKLTEDQRYSLIYEVVCTYVYQVLKAIFAPVDEQYKRRPWDNPFDWTGLWETATEDIVAIVAPKFKVIAHRNNRARNPRSGHRWAGAQGNDEPHRHRRDGLPHRSQRSLG